MIKSKACSKYNDENECLKSSSPMQELRGSLKD